MDHPRPHRVGEQLQKEISALLLKGLKDPRVGFVTITGVSVTPDMHLARVYYTVYGDETQRVDTQRGLKSAEPFIRRELSRRLRLRYVPELIFEFDKALEYGNRIDSLLRQLNEDQIRNEDQSSDD
ncbi:MAG: 30S ribosome-binding factor RbfA [Pedobacter sp.]